MKDLNKIRCPVCGKELCAMEPFYDTEENEWNYTCDDCGLNITIFDVAGAITSHIEEKENKPKSYTDIPSAYTPQEIEDIFRYRQREYAIEDAKFYIGQYVEAHDLSPEDAKMLDELAEDMAAAYLYKYCDVSRPEADVWESIVWKYHNEKVGDV